VRSFFMRLYSEVMKWLIDLHVKCKENSLSASITWAEKYLSRERDRLKLEPSRRVQEALICKFYCGDERIRSKGIGCQVSITL